MFLRFITNRVKWFSPDMDDPEVPENYADDYRYEVETLDEANLVSSLVSDAGRALNYHLPVLDLDYDAHLEPSTTPGHFHLYLNKRVSWEDYQLVLRAMQVAGLLEPGFVKLSQERGATFVRKPGHKKVKKRS